MVRFISGVGRHSVGGVSAIKTELCRCFDEWGLRWRWEHGTFVPTPHIFASARTSCSLGFCSVF